MPTEGILRICVLITTTNDSSSCERLQPESSDGDHHVRETRNILSLRVWSHYFSLRVDQLNPHIRFVICLCRSNEIHFKQMVGRRHDLGHGAGRPKGAAAPFCLYDHFVVYIEGTFGGQRGKKDLRHAFAESPSKWMQVESLVERHPTAL